MDLSEYGISEDHAAFLRMIEISESGSTLSIAES